MNNGKSERYSFSLRSSEVLLLLLIQRIKKHLNKEDHQLVSITEFCSYMGLDDEET
ncbi:MAG: hypothetical protein ACJA0U_003561 [Salibacteraceae bacterium]|jgi:hypothetical protein